jgi:hypothetical protein
MIASGMIISQGSSPEIAKANAQKLIDQARASATLPPIETGVEDNQADSANLSTESHAGLIALGGFLVGEKIYDEGVGVMIKDLLG